MPTPRIANSSSSRKRTPQDQRRALWWAHRSHEASLLSEGRWCGDCTVRRRNEPLSLGLQVFQVSVGHPTIPVNYAYIEGMLRKEGLIK
jgi:hypothetical protein